MVRPGTESNSDFGVGDLQVWINQGDIVLLSLRDFQDDKADVIVKYTADEARNRMCTISRILSIHPDQQRYLKSKPTGNSQKTPKSTKQTRSERMTGNVLSNLVTREKLTSMISSSLSFTCILAEHFVSAPIVIITTTSIYSVIYYCRCIDDFQILTLFVLIEDLNFSLVT